jgi:SAM-dependent methyltransferase
VLPCGMAVASCEMGLVKARDLNRILGEDILRLTKEVDRPIELLEAGCGRGWTLELGDRARHVTGVDIDELALQHRMNVAKDLDVAILGDLMNSDLVPADQFDVVYSAFVLEHIVGAERAMDNFVKWLRPGGLLVIRIPDGSTVFGFLGKVLPHRLHIFYERRVLNKPMAGQPGHGPYRAVYDPIVRASGIREICKTKDLTLDRMYRSDFATEAILTRPWNTTEGLKWRTIRAGMVIGGAVSLGRLDSSYNELAVVIQKRPADD